MLPPQLHSGLSSSIRHCSAVSSSSLSLRACPNSIIRVGTAYGQSRSFWGCRRGVDYASHIDPMFHRFTRYRTLKTRAKLLDKLRRHERWERDGFKPFFTSRHIRLASHWNGSGRPRWRCYNENDDVGSRDKEGETEENGYELSKREKEWKEQMERMRKRIEKDPYEAVFGKRFEPFWSPLVPSWMREEMGLQGWPKVKESVRAKSTSDAVATTADANRDAATPVSSQTSASPRPEQQGKKDVDTDTNDGPPNGQLTNYSYTSSTSWDSWTRKARREEWDSITGQTRRFEYDPISNRMVQVAAKLPADPAISKQPSKTTTTDSSGELPSASAPKSAHAADVASSSEAGAVDIPVKTIPGVRRPVPVPTQAVIESSKSATYFPSLLNTALTSSNPRTSIELRTADKDLELLTADDVRASVGRSKYENPAAESEQADLSVARAQRHGKVDPRGSEWDRAETRLMLEREFGILFEKKNRLLKQQQVLTDQKERRKEVQKIDAKMLEVEKQMLDLDAIQARNSIATYHASSDQTPLLPKSVPELVTTPGKGVMGSGRAGTLQSSLERMQSKDLSEIEEPDDSAAHESTGDRIGTRANGIPKGWHAQADKLQADRVHKSRDIGSKQTLKIPRWIDDMNARKAEYEAKKADENATDVEQAARIQKSNAMLEAEIQEQKSRMQAHENRYAHKIRSLRTEIETAYMQSNANAQMQVDRIRSLETELEKAQKAAGDFTAISKYASPEERSLQKIRDLRKELDVAFKQSSINAEMHVERVKNLEQELEKARKINANDAEIVSGERQRYVQKIRALRKELDNAFKQSSINAEMQVERIRALEKEINDSRKAPVKDADKGKAVETMRGEGDFCANVAKYAKNDSKWYKQTAFVPSTAAERSKAGMEKDEQKKVERALVREVKDIYEKRYGTIDQYHRQNSSGFAQPLQPRPLTSTADETHSDDKLGQALDQYDKQQTYRFRNATLENEIAVREREAHDAQALTASERSAKSGHEMTKSSSVSEKPSESRSEDANSPKAIPSLLDLPNAADQEHLGTANAQTTIWSSQWEEPPVYKILAYDSGNDMFSTATTSSNFTGKESPISIQQALSQLYQPSRFVAHFAGLQKEGYQVIHGTKDLLVFKKVKASPEPSRNEVEQPTTLQDHGLLRPRELRKSQNTSSDANIVPDVNPIDGTTRVPPEEPSTGSFASPTGFVGDRWEAIEHPTGEKTASNTNTESQYSQNDDIDIVHYPRIKREERVFTGSRLGHRSREHERRRKRHHHEPSQEEKREMRTKWNGYRSRMRWAVGVGLGAAALAYGVGAAAERKERKEMERWQEILEGKRTRWE